MNSGKKKRHCCKCDSEEKRLSSRVLSSSKKKRLEMTQRSEVLLEDWQFEEAFGMRKETFLRLPIHKQVQMKLEKNLML